MGGLSVPSIDYSHSIPGCVSLFQSMGKFQGMNIQIAGNDAVITGSPTNMVELSLLKFLLAGSGYRVDTTCAQANSSECF